MFFIVVQYIIKPSLYQTFLMSYRKQFEKEMNRIEGEKRKKYLEDKYNGEDSNIASKRILDTVRITYEKYKGNYFIKEMINK